MSDDEGRDLERSGPVTQRHEPRSRQTPSGVVVGLRVLGGCLGWGTLTGVVAAVAYLSVVMLTHADVQLDGGSLFVLAVVYGSTVGLAGGLVLGLGAGGAAALATALRGGSRGAMGADSPDRVRRVVWAARAGVLMVAALVFAVWRIGSSDSGRWLSSWELVLTVGLSVAFAVSCAGRSASRAVLGPRRTATPGSRTG